MTKLFAIVVALGFAFAFTAPALADTGAEPRAADDAEHLREGRDALGRASAEVLQGRYIKGPLHDVAR